MFSVSAPTRKGPWGGYFWPTMTALMVIAPLYHFRDEDSTLHIAFRVAWLVLLVLCLVEIGRDLELRPEIGGRRPEVELGVALRREERLFRS